MISIPPKHAVAQVVGFIKRKSAIHIARKFMERKRNFVGQNFWARGYFVSTVDNGIAKINSLAGVLEAMGAGGMEVVWIDAKNENGQLSSNSQLADSA